jgi:hypothetical protein
VIPVILGGGGSHQLGSICLKKKLPYQRHHKVAYLFFMVQAYLTLGILKQFVSSWSPGWRYKSGLLLADEACQTRDFFCLAFVVVITDTKCETRQMKSEGKEK